MKLLNGYLALVFVASVGTHIGVMLREKTGNNVVAENLQEFTSKPQESRVGKPGTERRNRRGKKTPEATAEKATPNNQAVSKAEEPINRKRAKKTTQSEKTPTKSEEAIGGKGAADPLKPEEPIKKKRAKKTAQSEKTTLTKPEEPSGGSGTEDPLNYLRFSMDMEEDYDLLENFYKLCKKRGSKHARDSMIFQRFEWRRNPHCRAIGEHPRIMQAARRVLKLPEDAPLYMFAINTLKRGNGSHHRLHTDREYTDPACTNPHSGATIWLLLKRSCNKPSPLHLLAGSHKLNLTAKEFLQERNCWFKTRGAPPCNTTQLLVEEAAKNPTLEVLKGPNVEGDAIAWPTTAWHQTDDVCPRTAITIQYASSLECAHSLYHSFPRAEKGAAAVFPEKAPFLKLGGSEDQPIAKTNATALDLFINGLEPPEASQTCIIKPPFEMKQLKRAQPVDKELYVSGPFVPNGNVMGHIGRSLKTKHGKFNRYLQTSQFAVWAGRTVYEASKKYSLAHQPHIETTLEICAVIEGKINYAISGDPSCADPFDVVTMHKNQVGIMFPTIPHTAMPDYRVDGEHICFKLSPLTQDDPATKRGSYVDSTKLAYRNLDVDLETYENRSLEIFYENKNINRLSSVSGPKKLFVPGFDRLHVKLTRYEPGETKEAHADKYDLIVLVTEGSPLEIHTPQGNSVVGLHEFALIPGGVEHGFFSKEGSRVLFIEALNLKPVKPQ